MENDYLGETTMDHLLRAELAREFPNLSAEFINAHPRQLMEMLTERKRQGLDPSPLLPAPIAETAGPDRQQQLLMLLDYCRDAILSGSDMDGLCILCSRTSGGMDMVFTRPCNPYAWLGFMNLAIGKLTGLTG